MKTTIELPNDLFRDAKLAAARRRITLKSLFTQALRKELQGGHSAPASVFKVDEDGFPYLPKRSQHVTAELVRQLDEDTL